MLGNAAGDVAMVATSGSGSENLTVGCSDELSRLGDLVQQECDWSICASPHMPDMCRQHSCSSWLIVRPGRLQASSGAESSTSAMPRYADLRNMPTSSIISGSAFKDVTDITLNERLDAATEEARAACTRAGRFRSAALMASRIVGFHGSLCDDRLSRNAWAVMPLNQRLHARWNDVGSEYPSRYVTSEIESDVFVR